MYVCVCVRRERREGVFWRVRLRCEKYDKMHNLLKKEEEQKVNGVITEGDLGWVVAYVNN